ncbi:hypothetical protein P0G10_14565 [Eubacteriales bacterium DFI.9.88]|nr:hypothetical protein [Eubacteriales bacterium DFI.9.88]
METFMVFNSIGGDLNRDSVVANFATTAADGKTYHVDYCSYWEKMLDRISYMCFSAKVLYRKSHYQSLRKTFHIQTLFSH